jgi:hypothetical protein
MMYAKVFESIVRSSVWSESLSCRILWVTMLVTADREGFVFGSVDGLARVANLTIEDTREAIETLLSPDSNSSDLIDDPENNGRRVETVSRGWRIINYAYYRDLQRAEDRREKARKKKAEQRERKRRAGAVSPCSVPSLSPRVPESPTSELDSELDKRERASASPAPRGSKKGTTGTRTGRPASFDEVRTYWTAAELRGDPARFFDHFQANGWKQGRVDLRDWRPAARNWSRRESEFSSTMTAPTSFGEYADPPDFSEKATR